ncbi:hypothetical protein [Pseudoprevotella muciniphila]|nr:hypothetical protein [Pseudoprevotella muciniphila]
MTNSTSTPQPREDTLQIIRLFARIYRPTNKGNDKGASIALA